MRRLASGQTAVLVHDHPLRLAGIERTLRELGVFVLARATRCEEAVPLLERANADLVVIGVNDTPERDSLELVRDVREQAPDAQIVALVETTDVEGVEAVLEAGADVCVIETPDHRERAAAVQQALEWSAAMPVRRERVFVSV